MENEERGEASSSQNGSITITEIKKGGIRGKKTEIVLSDGSSFFLSPKIVRTEGLEKGCSFPVERLGLLLKLSEEESACNRALTLLSRREHSETELRKKLLNRGYSVKAIDNVTKKLKYYGYIDDGRFAREWLSVRLRNHPEGRRALYFGLLKKGVKREIAEDTIKEVLTAEAEMMALEKAIKQVSGRTGYDKAKMKRALSGRGFSLSLIKVFLEEQIFSLIFWIDLL
ncbi:MAG: hypothetical protein DRP87_12100 [Spirochaetes bacterium]|nr:MAG: hypothetical protein DRP87_12100 [Spirochaetota bacterium]